MAATTPLVNFARSIVDFMVTFLGRRQSPRGQQLTRLW